MELTGCSERWVDIFVTKADDDPTTRGLNTGETAGGNRYTYDDVFCCTVQSIEFDPADNSDTRAYITTNNSEWILPTWSHANSYGSAAAAASAYATLKVGDLVRIGGIPTEGFTDYLTVVEVKKVATLANATAGVVSYTNNVAAAGQSTGTHQLAAPTTASAPASLYQLYLSTDGIAHIAIRLNASLNCTTLPDNTLRRDTDWITHRQHVVGYANKYATLQTRSEAYEYISTVSQAYPNESDPTEKYYYPLYMAKNWTHGKELVARLDHGVKQVSAVKLVGYSLVNKRQVGIQHSHEMQADDYLILRIREIEGHVISNNKFANGAFAILRTGDTSHTITGAAEFSSYEPSGIVCVPVHASNSTIRNMTIEITDRRGESAHFGRLHLWFKILVTHG